MCYKCCFELKYVTGIQTTLIINASLPYRDPLRFERCVEVDLRGHTSHKGHDALQCKKSTPIQTARIHDGIDWPVNVFTSGPSASNVHATSSRPGETTSPKPLGCSFAVHIMGYCGPYSRPLRNLQCQISKQKVLFNKGSVILASFQQLRHWRYKHYGGLIWTVLRAVSIEQGPNIQERFDG